MGSGPVRVKFVKSIKLQLAFEKRVQEIIDNRQKFIDAARGRNPVSDEFRSVFERQRR